MSIQHRLNPNFHVNRWAAGPCKLITLVSECNGDFGPTMRSALRKSLGFAASRAGSRDGTIPSVWSWRRERSRDGFPERFRVQRVGVIAAMAISDLPSSEIA